VPISQPDHHPLVYEINTRLWLAELSHTTGHRLTLADIPNDQFSHWTHFGFTHLWLMGVWECGPALESRDPDAAPSPYAILQYRVAEAFGGPPALADFRRRLRAHGLKLLLDFVPNHTSCEHRWLGTHPAYYVQSPSPQAGCFQHGSCCFAHGKDPYFPAWIDTAQLDYRNPATRAAMIAELLAVAPQCDGVRCDMSMLLLNDVFLRTWKDFPVSHTPPQTEFWPDAIAGVRRSHPDFLFLAEAYWDLEERLLTLGFDFAYDKRIYDHLIARNPRSVVAHLRSKSADFLSRTTHFLENHDEPRIASLLSFEEHRAASLVALALPGMRLLHEGQLTGAKIRASVHRKRRPAEPVQDTIAAWYERLLHCLKTSAVGHGTFDFLPELLENVVAVRWRSADRERLHLAVVNLAAGPNEFLLPLPGAWQITDCLDRSRAPWQIQNQVKISLVPHAAHLLHLQRPCLENQVSS
jgi:hypothetical protein